VDEVRRREQAKEEAARARREGKRAELRRGWDLCRARGVKVGEPFDARADNPRQAEALPVVDEVRAFSMQPPGISRTLNQSY
jgi:hypothetical protein